jgi:hypothetical protein
MAQSVFFFDDAEVVDVTPGSAGSWVDVDVSAYIPAGATGVLLKTHNSGVVHRNCNFRKNGSTDAYTDNIIHGLEASYNSFEMTGVDGSRIFETNVENITDVQVYLIGYTGAGITFFDNYHSLSELPVVFEDIDCSAFIPVGATGVIVRTDSQDFKFVRGKGSTDSYPVYDFTAHGTEVIKLNSSRVFEAYESEEDIYLYVIGYITDGVTFNLNRSYIGNSGDSIYSAVEIPPSAGGLFYGQLSNIRYAGSIEDVQGFHRNQIFSACNQNNDIEAIASGVVAIYLSAYCEGTGPSGDVDIDMPLIQIKDIRMRKPWVYLGLPEWTHPSRFHCKQQITEEEMNIFFKGNLDYLKTIADGSLFPKMATYIGWSSLDGFNVTNDVQPRGPCLYLRGYGTEGYDPLIDPPQAPAAVIYSGIIDSKGTFKCEDGKQLSFEFVLLNKTVAGNSACLYFYLADSTDLATMKAAGFMITWGQIRESYVSNSMGVNCPVGDQFTILRCILNPGNWIKYFVNNKLIKTRALPVDASDPVDGTELKVFIRADATMSFNSVPPNGLHDNYFTYADSEYKISPVLITRGY